MNMISKTFIAVTAGICLSLTACSKSDNKGADTVKTPAYQFTTTNWNDGWTSNVRANWAEVVKGNITVLLHYPQAATQIGGDPTPIVNNAWDILVAPRYSNLRNYRVASPSLDYERAYIGYGNVTDANNREVFVLLFKKGNSGWIEFITPDKNTFTAQFGLDPATVDWSTSSSVWGPLRVMANYNRFAVASTDLDQTGRWSNNFANNTYYYNMYTGLGGMSSYNSQEDFTFTGSSKYNWKLLVTNSNNGSTNFTTVNSSGRFQLTDNWNATFSDIEGRPKSYPVWFAAVKNGRVLFIDGNPFNWVGR